MQTFQDAEGGIANIGRSYKKYGLHVQDNGDIKYIEWAPAAKSLSIFGDFNFWNRDELKAEMNPFGQWSIILKANPDGTPRIPHNSKWKIQIEDANGKKHDKNSAWSPYSVQDEKTMLFNCVHWNPPQKYDWQYERPVANNIKNQSLRIYEAHVGMA